MKINKKILLITHSIETGILQTRKSLNGIRIYGPFSALKGQLFKHIVTILFRQ